MKSLSVTIQMKALALLFRFGVSYTVQGEFDRLSLWKKIYRLTIQTKAI